MMRKSTDSDDRNQHGYPRFNVWVDKPERSNTHIDQSINKALPWIAFSWFLSGGAILGLIVLSIMIPNLIDAKVDSKVAKAEANSELALKAAYTAKDMVDVYRAREKAKQELEK